MQTTKKIKELPDGISKELKSILDRLYTLEDDLEYKCMSVSKMIGILQNDLVFEACNKELGDNKSACDCYECECGFNNI